ncbi:MAG: hypothetical protein CSA22_09175 [Deltaproteobacteria bacterium]|nr:MAG: hypothetical protein CSA22_09175 [Deltaproteobacteria bacterium]
MGLPMAWRGVVPQMRCLTRFFLLFLCAGLLLAAGFLCVHTLKQHPELLNQTATYLLDTVSGGTVKMTAVSQVSIKDRISLCLSGVTVGDDDSAIRVSVDQVVLVLRPFREWDGLMPALAEVTLAHPTIRLGRSMFQKKKSGRFPHLPMNMLKISDGDVRIDGMPEGADRIRFSGIWRENGAHLSGMWAGGKIYGEMHASAEKGQTCDFSVTGVHLGNLHAGIRGTADLALAVQAAGDRLAWEVSVASGEGGVSVGSWKLGPLAVSGKGGVSRKKKTVTADRLALILPEGRVEGQLTVAQTGASFDPKTAVVTLDLSSGFLSWEALLKRVPAGVLPDRLDTLLTKQIREGAVRVAHITYAGPLEALTCFRKIAKRLRVVLDVKDGQFRTPGSPEAIQVTAGQVRFEDEDLIVGPLCGHMGMSPIDSVRLRFVDVLTPGRHIEVNASVDMPLIDFHRAWRAGVEPFYIRKPLLKPMAHPAPDGRIRGQIQADFIKRNGDRRFRCKGRVWFDNCTFDWGRTRLSDISGDLNIPDWNAPIVFNWTGCFGNLPLAHLSLEVKGLGPSLNYNFDLKTDRFPDAVPVWLAPDAVVRFQGTGDRKRYKGDLQVLTRELRTPNVRVAPAGGLIVGMGYLSGSPDRSEPLTLSSGYLDTGEGIVTVALEKTAKTGVLKLDGIIGASGITVPRIPGSFETGQVGGSLNLTWGASGLHWKGTLACDAAVWQPPAGPKMILNGTLRYQDRLLTTRMFRIETPAPDPLVTDVAGSLTLSSGGPVFNGFVMLDGLTIRKKKAAGHIPDWVRTLTADADLELRSAFLQYLPVDHATGHVSVRDAVLCLEGLKGRGAVGTARASGRVHLDGSGRIALDMVLEESEIQALLKCLSDPESCRADIPDGQRLISGHMALDGHLEGTPAALYGQFVFRAEEGRVWKYALLSKIFGVLNLYKFINTAELDFMKDGFPYNRITGTFHLKGNQITCDDFRLDSNSLQMSGMGTFDRASGTIDAVAGVQLFETLDRAIGSIPVLGWVLTGDEKKLSVISLSITGDVKNPKITLMPAETISRPLKESLLRLLNLPGTLLKDLGAAGDS